MDAASVDRLLTQSATRAEPHLTYPIAVAAAKGDSLDLNAVSDEVDLDCNT